MQKVIMLQYFYQYHSASKIGCPKLEIKITNYRSSRSQMFLKIGVLKNFANFTEKHPCRSLRACNFIKKRLQHICFPVKFAKCLRTTFYRTPPVTASQINPFHATGLFLCPLKHHKTRGFLMFSGGIAERDL